jgi:NADH dehydrogenase (ubiquinone) 1 beta subcomplex subunit 8
LSAESRDPYYPWDFPEYKRNFNDPMHVQADMYGEDRYDVSAKPRFSLLTQALAFFGVMGFSGGLYLWLERYKLFRPVLPKQIPSHGGAHYTFEPAE